MSHDLMFMFAALDQYRRMLQAFVGSLLPYSSMLRTRTHVLSRTKRASMASRSPSAEDPDHACRHVERYRMSCGRCAPQACQSRLCSTVGDFNEGGRNNSWLISPPEAHHIIGHQLFPPASQAVLRSAFMYGYIWQRMIEMPTNQHSPQPSGNGIEDMPNRIPLKPCYRTE